jgi:hypothetical protein
MHQNIIARAGLWYEPEERLSSDAAELHVAHANSADFLDTRHFARNCQTHIDPMYSHGPIQMVALAPTMKMRANTRLPDLNRLRVIAQSWTFLVVSRTRLVRCMASAIQAGLAV